MITQTITKTLRPLGIFFILSFSFMSVFWTLVLRDIDPETFWGRIADYSVSFDNRFYDFRMRAHLDSKFVSKDISLVSIDDYSLQKIGTWPIPRTYHAKMLRKLKHFGAKVVGMDIMFPEKAPVCGPSSPDNDFAQAIEDFQADGNRVFVAYTVVHPHEEGVFPEAPLELLDSMIDSQTASDVNMAPKKVANYTFPNQTLLDSKVGMAYINSQEDSDGIFRHYQLVSNLDSSYYGSLGYAMYSEFTDEKPILKVNKDGAGQIDFGDKTLEIDSRGEVKVRYIGGTQNFLQIPLYDLINSKDDDEEVRKMIEGRMIFVGSTGTGAHDIRHSPIDPKMPGVFAHINIAEMLQQRHFYKPQKDSVQYSLIILFLGVVIIFGVMRFSNALLDIITLIFMIGGIYVIDYFHFLPAGYELKLFYCFFCFTSCYSWITFLNFMETTREKKQIKGTFARYVAPTIVDEMLQDPEKLVVGGFRRDITCLFSDVRDFTSISEGLSAAELAHSLNMYMGKMTDIVFETKGTLDKYIGDAIVAFWGAPLEIGNHAQYAVEGAIKMINTLPAINEEFKKLGRPQFNVGVGLNSGECNVGNMGSDRIFSYTALGDNMNLGARLEGLCKYYGTQILISEYTLSRLEPNTVKVRPIDKVIVKGKTKPVAIFEVLHGWHPMTLDPEAYNFYLSAWDLFQKKNFSSALSIFEQILMGLENDKPTKRMRDLCKKYVDHPELVDDYFDVTKMTEK